MRLVSCHIKNFGNLTNRDYDFSNGINSFIEKNGTGKSTLAAFIKAMLYGMDSTKTNDKDFKERKHYAPFNEQSYGGSLIFYHNNKRYKIEKTFDLKSSAKDEIKIYEDDKLTNRRTDIGEEILGLDKDSFERLIFISEKDIQMTSNGNIKKNLNNIIADTTERVDFDAIKEKLSELEKKYGSGKNGLKTELNNTKNELEEKIINQEKVSKALSEKYQKRNELDAKLKVLQEKQKIISNKKEKLAFWENYHKQIGEINKKKNELVQINLKYPKGLPEKTEISELEKLENVKKQLIGEINGSVFSKEKEEKLEELKNKFQNGVPSDDEMKELDEKEDDLNKNTTLLDNTTFPVEDKNLLKNLNDEFKSGLPSEEDIFEINKKIESYKKTKTILSSEITSISQEDEEVIKKFSNKDLEAAEAKVNDLFEHYKTLEKENDEIAVNETVSKAPNKSLKITFILLILSIIFVCAGVGLIFKMLVLGIALIIVGVMGIFSSAFLYLKKKIENTEKKYSNNVPNKTNTKKAELESIASEITNILKDYNINTSSVYSDVERFTNECNDFKKAVQRNKKYKEDKNNNETILKDLEIEISNFLLKYIEISDICKDFEKIKEDINKFEELKWRFKNYKNRIEKINEKILNLKTEIKNIVGKYGIELNESYTYKQFINNVNDYKTLTREYLLFIENKKIIFAKKEEVENKIRLIDNKYDLGIFDGKNELKTLNIDINRIDALTKEIQEKETELKRYKEEKKLIDGEEVKQEDIVDYDEDINAMLSELSNKTKEIESDELYVDDLEDNKSKLEETKKEIVINNHELDIIKKTEKIFVDSQKELDKKYVSPIMDKFKHYSDLLKNSIGANIEMGRDFNITLNVNGETKSDGHLSSGQRSVCALCFRLALLDNIYNDNVPFIIMDDSFVMLDDENIRASINLIKELSKKEQIIYFSCHESRKI